jgi:hypothetical protein
MIRDGSRDDCHSFLIDMIEGIDGIDMIEWIDLWQPITAAFLLPGAELFGEGVLDLEAVAAFGGEIDVFWPGEELFFFVFAEDAACVLGDDLDALEGGAFAAGVGADEADVGPVWTAGAALVSVEDEPHGPLPGVVVEADFFDVSLGKGACGFVALGGVVGDGELFGLHGSDGVNGANVRVGG